MAVALTWCTGVAAQPPPPAQYVYDDDGRLVGVIDNTGANLPNNVAIYRYDPVGNLTAIERVALTALSIIDFTPTCFSPGSTVTIYGTGFSATPTQNTVYFPAASGCDPIQGVVTQASVTTLVVTVPANIAASGPITVQVAGAGSRTSVKSYQRGCAAPIITSVTPMMGAGGTVVTINGTGFETNPPDNAVRFNGRQGPVDTATAIQVTTRVPVVATSGKITLATPFGTATSPGDFFVPPSPTSVIGPKDRMTIGQTRTLTFTTANTIGLMLFDGMEQQVIRLQQTNTIGTVTTRILNPDGTELAAASASASRGPFMLFQAGTYTIVVDPAGATGSVTLTLSLVPILQGRRLYLHDFDMSPFAGPPPAGIVWRRTNSKRGTNPGVSWACVETNQERVIETPANQTIAWVSPPLAGPVTLGGTVSFGVWGLENSAQANAAYKVFVRRFSAVAPSRTVIDDAEMAVGTSGCDGAPGTGAVLHTAEAQGAAVAIAAGDRLRISILVTNAPGQTMSGTGGRHSQTHYNRSNAGADGASYVEFAETLTFDCTNPDECAGTAP